MTTRPEAEVLADVIRDLWGIEEHLAPEEIPHAIAEQAGVTVGEMVGIVANLLDEPVLMTDPRAAMDMEPVPLHRTCELITEAVAIGAMFERRR